MGCSNSADTKNKPPAAGGKAASKPAAEEPAGGAAKELRLLDEYSVGKKLGEGAFGVVSICKKRATGEEFAVKMVDKVETPVDAIKKEAELLKNMDHPNIVKCHGVYYERCFVCIVMDMFSGGDLVEGLQRHLKERGQINCFDVVHVSRQMSASIEYLHKNNLVHRDVKGDNFLMDRKDMTDQKCRIVLTDFGTVCDARPDDRLSASVGTKLFWPPEFFNKDYGQKVDVWAVGVVLYGLASGRFPFRDENDVKTKELKIPKRVHADCEDLIRKMLAKVEKERPSSTEIMAHRWVADKNRAGGGGASAAGGPDDDVGGVALGQEDVNAGVQERRQELMSRLNREHEAQKGGGRQTGSTGKHLQKTFVLKDKQVDGATFTYEWWGDAKINREGLLNFAGTKTSGGANTGPASQGEIKLFAQMLADHNINTAQFGKGKAKTLEEMAGEVRTGAARLMLDATEHKKLVRVVDVVLFKLEHQGKLLIETSEQFADGRKRETQRLPGTKKEPHENTKQTAERVLQDMCGLKTDMVKFDLNKIDRFEEEIESPSYPGVCTVYRKEIMKASMVNPPPQSLLDGVKGQEGMTKFFTWLTDQQAKDKKVKLEAGGAEAISALVRAPIGLNEAALNEHLTGLGVDTSAFGKSPDVKSLKDFSQELVKGESTLMQDASGTVTRVVDVVVMIVKNPKTGEVLVETEQNLPNVDKKIILNRLPGAKCRPDENQFTSAKRILRRQLEIGENEVTLEKEPQAVEEEKPSHAYPGIKTVYRKRLINAYLDI